MPSEQPSDSSELLDDIRYVNQITKDEIKRSKGQLRQLVDNTPMPSNVAESLIDEISKQLGQLTAKVDLAEKAVHTLKARQKSRNKARRVAAKIQNENQSTCLSFDANQLEENNNLLPMQESASGINYCWSGADPEILFSFSLDRTKALGMYIWLFALIKPEYSRQLKVLVDGQHIKHFFSADGPLFVVSCVLPPAGQSSQTEIKLILPDTHSPTDLGGALDGRKLGIAIHKISFGKPESGFSHLLKRLKLKS